MKEKILKKNNDFSILGDFIKEDKFINDEGEEKNYPGKLMKSWGEDLEKEVADLALNQVIDEYPKKMTDVKKQLTDSEYDSNHIIRDLKEKADKVLDDLELDYFDANDWISRINNDIKKLNEEGYDTFETDNELLDYLLESRYYQPSKVIKSMINDLYEEYANDENYYEEL